jgi:uncharacterized NAD-dependent epimerase/dehydratase family protein
MSVRSKSYRVARKTASAKFMAAEPSAPAILSASGLEALTAADHEGLQRPTGPYLIPAMPRYLIYSEGQFGTPSSKTGNSVIRYSGPQVAAVIDSRYTGKRVDDVLGFGGDIPIVESVDAGIALGGDALLVGVAMHGAGFPPGLSQAIRTAIDRGLEIWNGLHLFVGDDPELAALAKERGVKLHDVRRPPPDLPVGTGRVRETEATVLLAVGSDANIGKMTVMLQLQTALRARGTRAKFAPTGQTGIFIEGWGLCVDAVVADFIAGASEEVTLQAARDADIVLVEGQGSILHPGYSGVSLGLLHGSLPHGLIACHQPSRTTFRHNAWLPIPPITEVIALHEAIAAPLRPAKTIGVSLNTSDLSDAEARKAIAKAADETGLPTTDPVRYEIEPLLDAVLAFDASRRGL